MNINTIADIKSLYLSGNKISAMNYLKNKDRINEIRKTQKFPVNICDKTVTWLWLNDKLPCICTYCNTRHKIIKTMADGLHDHCGHTECKSQSRSNAYKRGWAKKDKDKIIKKTQQTNINKWGAKSNLSAGTTSREYAKQKLIERWGVDHPSKSTEIINKTKQTFNKRYGGRDIVNNEKTKKTNLKKWGVEYIGSSVELSKRGGLTQQKNRFSDLILRSNTININITDDNDRIWLDCKCTSCSTIHKNIHRITLNRSIAAKETFCYICNPDILKFRSNGEMQIGKFLEFLNIQYVINKKAIFDHKHEVDITIPSHKLCIEFNGLYWHSEIKKGQSYHTDKKTNLHEMGYDLIHIWEDDWNNPIKKDIIKSRIKNKLNLSKNKIGARSCKIKEITAKHAKEFLEKNHIQGYTNSSIKIGLFLSNELVSVGTFSKPRSFISGKSSKYDLELIRFATKGDTVVVGGLSRIISYLKKNFTFSNLVSYADCDWTSFNSLSYLNAGFSYSHKTNPGYWWVINGIRQNRFNYTRWKLKDIQDDQTVDSYMSDRGYYKVWNSGNIVYELQGVNVI